MNATNPHPNTAAVRTYRPLSALVPTHWHSGEISTQDGATLHYTRTGRDKSGIVLLHGVQVDGLSWLRTAQALESAYDVVMPDSRGHGRSSRVSDNFSSALLVSDVAAVVRALDLDRPYVVGHSMGADIAGRFAA